MANIYETFLKELIAGNRTSCSKIIQKLISDGDEIETVYFNYLEKAMYDIGLLWEKNKISVANEHMATAIVEGIMNQVFPQFEETDISNGKTIVLACSNEEHHQVGVKMIADLFEYYGWQSFFIGANTPPSELIRVLEDKNADLLGLSLSIHFNLEHLENALLEVNKSLPNLKIIIGGQAIIDLPKDFSERYKNVSIITSKELLFGIINA